MAITLGYHGCSKETAQQVLSGSPFQLSNKSYDWLGEGSYFWENDILRAYEWAVEHRPPYPCVVGAVIDLGNCLDLTTRSGVGAVRLAYENYKKLQMRAGKALPKNLPGKYQTDDFMVRHLDRAVIDHLHTTYRIISKNDGGKTREFDTVRAMFSEGKPIYETAGFFEKTHVQIAVRNDAQILGVFRIPSRQLTGLNLPDFYK